MREISPPTGSVAGRYKLIASSAQAEREWRRMGDAQPESAVRAYDRLANEPLTRYGGRQHALHGKKNRPFWELEASAAYRIVYAVDMNQMTIIIAVVNDVHSGSQVTQLVESRGGAARNHGLLNDE